MRVSPAGEINFFTSRAAKLRARWKTKGLRFAKAPRLGRLCAPRGESPPVQSPAHRQQLSHWPSLQSFLLPRFAAGLCLAARKKSHILPVGVGKAATASGYLATKNKGEIVAWAASAGSGPASGTLLTASRFPGHKEQQAEPAAGAACVPAHSPTGLPTPVL